MQLFYSGNIKCNTLNILEYRKALDVDFQQESRIDPSEGTAM